MKENKRKNEREKRYKEVWKGEMPQDFIINWMVSSLQTRFPFWIYSAAQNITSHKETDYLSTINIYCRILNCDYFCPRSTFLCPFLVLLSLVLENATTCSLP